MRKPLKIALIMESVCSYIQGVFSGIIQYSRLNGPWTLYSEPPWRSGLGWLKDWCPDGIVLFSFEKKDVILAMGLPMIVCFNTKDLVHPFPHILPDAITIGEMAARHLLDCGLRNFAFCGFRYVHWSVARGKSFANIIAECGFHVHFYQRPWKRLLTSWNKEQALMADWLKSLPKPVGLLACDDEHAQFVARACKLAALKVPDDVAIIGVDDDKLVCELTDPPLSSIALNAEGAGYAAAELLDKLIAGEKMASQIVTVIPTHVCVRQSTDILQIDDPEVVDAIRFIRLHAKELIQVSDVIRHVAVSRRSLECRFRRSLGRSIYHEIRHVRVEQITRMLAETNQSISKIALALGYPDADNLARYFRKEKGMTPLAFRKKYGHI